MARDIINRHHHYCGSAHTHSLYKEIVKSVELQQQVDYLVLWLVSIRACYLGKVLSFAVL